MAWPTMAPTTPFNDLAADWMSQLPDDVRVMDLSIPGTHDSASLKGFQIGEGWSISATQQWKIEDQLTNGIRFLDLRVKIKSGQELAMYHSSDMIYDPYEPTTYNQLYFRKVVDVIVSWLEQHPRETVILCVKDEQNEYDALGTKGALELGQAVYVTLTQVNQQHNAPTNPNYHGMLHSNWVDATLGEARGRLILWCRFAKPVLNDPASYPGADFTALSSTALDGTTGALLNSTVNRDVNPPDIRPVAWVQDAYNAKTFKTKFAAWLACANQGLDSRRTGSRSSNNDLAFLNFGSQAGGYPETNAGVLNPIFEKWLAALSVRPAVDQGIDADIKLARTGSGVIALDFPPQTLISKIIWLNFQRSYRLHDFKSGLELMSTLINEAAAAD